MKKVLDKKIIDSFTICLQGIMDHDPEWPLRYQQATGKSPWQVGQSKGAPQGSVEN